MNKYCLVLSSISSLISRFTSIIISQHTAVSLTPLQPSAIPLMRIQSWPFSRMEVATPVPQTLSEPQRKGTSLPLSQLVEETRSKALPNHLLDSSTCINIVPLISCCNYSIFSTYLHFLLKKSTPGWKVTVTSKQTPLSFTSAALSLGRVTPRPWWG